MFPKSGFFREMALSEEANQNVKFTCVFIIYLCNRSAKRGGRINFSLLSCERVHMFFVGSEKLKSKCVAQP